MSSSSSNKIEDHEKIVKQIAKTSDSIRKKYRALKTGKMEENLALEKHFKPIIEPLKQIVENTKDKTNPINKTFFSVKEEYGEPKSKRKRLNTSFDESFITSTPVKSMSEQMETALYSFNETLKPEILQPRKDNSEVANKPLITSEGQEELQTHYGPLGQKYVEFIITGEKAVDNVYGVYYGHDGLMLGAERFDLDTNDDIILDKKRYAGTPGLYELIFKKFPDESTYTSIDMENYKNMLLVTNAHRRNHSIDYPIMGNRGYKYKKIIAPLLSDKRKVGTGIPRVMILKDAKSSLLSGKKVGKDIPCAMTLNDNKIDYVDWDDPNELVNRLRLFVASHQAGHNAHDNEILSIIEE